MGEVPSPGYAPRCIPGEATSPIYKLSRCIAKSETHLKFITKGGFPVKFKTKMRYLKIGVYHLLFYFGFNFVRKSI